MIKKLLLLLLIISPIVFTNAKTLRVGYINTPPYVILKNKLNPGVAVDIWKAVAKENKWTYKFINEGVDLPAAFDKLKNHKIDALIGGISVTNKRLEKAVFSRPIYITRTGLMISKNAKESIWRIIKKITTSMLTLELLFFGVFFYVLLHLIWKILDTEEIPRDYKKGISRSLLFFILAVFTQNFQYDMFKTRARRILTFFLAITSISLLSLFISIFSSAFSYAFDQKNIINTLADLSGKTLLAFKGSSDYTLLTELGLRIMPTKSMSEAIKLIEEKKAFGMISNTPGLKYFIKKHPHANVFLTNFTLDYHEVAFAFPRNRTNLKSQFNLGFSKLQENEMTQQICRPYFGTSDAKYCAL